MVRKTWEVCDDSVVVQNEPSSVIVISRKVFASHLSRRCGRDFCPSRHNAYSMISISPRLQAKTREKLGAGNWLATDRSVQQATAWQVAKLKAGFLAGANRDNPIFDLCSGIGGDAIWFGKHRRLIAVDSDPTLVQMCAENLRRSGIRSAAVVCRSVESIDVPANAFVHIDPDRRSARTRASQTPSYQPSWDFVVRLATRQPASMIKIAPAARIEQNEEFHRMWFSLKGSVREQTLLWGESFHWAGDVLQTQLSHQVHSAIIVSGDGNHSQFLDTPNQKCDVVAHPKEFMIAPDSAIRAAGLTEALANRINASAIGSPAGFLTSASHTDLAGVICEPIIWTGASDDRKLRRELRALNAFPIRVKTRGVEHDANELERRYRGCGENPVTLWIGRSGQKRYAAVTQTLRGSDSRRGL